MDEEAAAGEPITIVIADDHQVVRAGLRLLLEAEDGFEVVAEAGDVATTERRVTAYQPARADPRPQHARRVEPARRSRGCARRAPDTQIVVLTMQNDPAFAREALRAGAIGYVLKEAADAELVQAVRLAADGRTYLNPELGARLAAEPPAAVGPPDDLTARELEVLRLIALGHTNGEIASPLYLSVRTVESHRAHIQQKTRRTTRADLVAYAREHRAAVRRTLRHRRRRRFHRARRAATPTWATADSSDLCGETWRPRLGGARGGRGGRHFRQVTAAGA